MSDRLPNLGAMPSRQGHAPSLSTGAASAQAGMVRIQRGSETRYVWPVHLPGWLAIGWQVGSGEGMAAATPAALVVETPEPSTPARTTPGISGHRPGTSVGMGSTGRPAPATSAPQPVPATTTSDSREAATPAVEQAISPSAAADSPRQPEADLTAHLPTNLLGLDQEETTAQKVTPAENDAGSAWNLAPGPADHSADAAGAVDPAGASTGELATAPFAAEAESEQELQTAPNTDTPAAETTAAAADRLSEPAAAAEVAVRPAPARRGRPRKMRPEAQPAATTEATDQEQAPTTDVIDEQQPPTALLTTEGDDPFGLDPLL